MSVSVTVPEVGHVQGSSINSASLILRRRIVYERLIDDERRVHAAGLLSSLQMLLASTGGFDFTGADCTGWMREAGFGDIRIEPLTTAQSMVVGIK